MRNIGTSFTKDRSLELFRDAKQFVQKHLGDDEDAERVFLARVAMRPCFVLASNKLVKEFLEGGGDGYYNGLKDFFHGLFGHSIVFASGGEAEEFRRLILPLFGPSEVAAYEETVADLVGHWAESELKETSSVMMYESFKRLSLALNLKLFLGLDARTEPELFEDVSRLTTRHWHGVKFRRQP